MSGRTIFSCYVADCKHHNLKKLECTRDEISIFSDKGGLPICDGYQVKEECKKEAP